MKRLTVLVALLSFILLAGCGTKQSPTNSSIDQQQRTKLITKNQKSWNQKVKAAQQVEYFKWSDASSIPYQYNDDIDMARLKSGNQSVIKAQVINLQPEKDRYMETETKATIYVEKVISGDKKLQGKMIKTEFSEGLAQAKYRFTMFEGEYVGQSEYGVNDPKTMTYTENPNKPIPKIGSQIIVGISRYKPETKDRAKMYQKYGLTSKNFYVINNPEVTFWIKSKGKYKLNNSAFYQKKNQKLVPNILKLTEQINKQD